jgi:hypothetical protein
MSFVKNSVDSLDSTQPTPLNSIAAATAAAAVSRSRHVPFHSIRQHTAAQESNQRNKTNKANKAASGAVFSTLRNSLTSCSMECVSTKDGTWYRERGREGEREKERISISFADTNNAHTIYYFYIFSPF